MDGDPVAVAKAAEQRFHAACDEWAAARAAGAPTAPLRNKINLHHGEFLRALKKTKYEPNNESRWTRELAAAGSYRKPDGSTWSYNVGTGQSGLIVAGWKRADWTHDALPGHGLALSVGVAPYHLKDDFHVGVGRWDEKGRVLRVPYLLVDVAGTFELHVIDGKWSFHPDRGVMEQGNWWKPFESAATRPAE